MSMWVLTPTEIAYFKRIGQCEGVDDLYVSDMIPLLFDHVNEECAKEFTVESMTASVKLFLAQALAFFSVMQPGLEGERVGSVSFNYDFSKLPDTITGLLSQYGYGKKRGIARFRPF